jgi:hypothetical protein
VPVGEGGVRRDLGATKPSGRVKGEKGEWEELLKKWRGTNGRAGEAGRGRAVTGPLNRKAVVRRYFFFATRDSLTSPFTSRDQSIRETVMDSFPVIPRNVKHAGGDFSAAGQALAAAGNVCLMLYPLIR